MCVLNKLCLDKVKLYEITIYIAIITSGWMKNGMVMQSYESFITKKFAMNITPEISMRAFYEI